MPGSQISADFEPDGQLVDAATPTLDGQIVDAATAAMEKIRKKAEVAKGNFMEWFGGNLKNVEASTSKPDAAKILRDNQGISLDMLGHKFSGGDNIPAGPVLQHSSSSPGYALSSSSSFTSPHGSSRGSRAPSVMCPSPAEQSPSSEPQTFHGDSAEDAALSTTSSKNKQADVPFPIPPLPHPPSAAAAQLGGAAGAGARGEEGGMRESLAGKPQEKEKTQNNGKARRG
eukprot:CAMPEP_0181314608 /NCGR_PEP_ID=MMETSP1101-20121128/14913_1 /TAXON_ID=46948 /ORGANISM="Rhodomonas abbreviata, Strain Caron Lab Isolate" /LENGTH=228 /DNA_ID=CAMNT_0023421721 /DNA_START=109 /DNA_END=791 /DNA_ORIENTATION=-